MPEEVLADIDQGIKLILDPAAVDTWWHTPVPAFDGLDPEEMFVINPAAVLSLVKSYADPSFS